MQTYHCLRCGQTNIPNRLGHLKNCDKENYDKAVSLMREIDIIMENIDRAENELTISRANINRLEQRQKELRKE